MHFKSLRSGLSVIATIVLMLTIFVTQATAANSIKNDDLLWIKARAKDKFERSKIANAGASIEMTRDDYVIVLGNKKIRERLKKMGVLESSFKLDSNIFDFPSRDANFHTYAQTVQFLQTLANTYPTVAKLSSIGKSTEGREIMKLRISGQLTKADSLPGVVFMGAHHAREHLSVEIPLLLAQTILSRYASGDAEMKRLVDNRDIHIIPLVNPDGAEYDISDGNYRMWRKNRANVGGSPQGVDLNRNYSYFWGAGGSSNDPSDDTYMGPQPFSEPETRAIRDFVDAQKNLSTLLTFHTFSELVLYPWGHSHDPIPNQRDHDVFTKMAQTMAQWNGYTPEQASDLYIASGDTTDWAYGTHGIFAFTFEMDPTSMFQGGFYPGQDVIPTVFEKNLKPCLYMIDVADNPYKVLTTTNQAFGFQTDFLK